MMSKRILHPEEWIDGIWTEVVRTERVSHTTEGANPSVKVIDTSSRTFGLIHSIYFTCRALYKMKELPITFSVYSSLPVTIEQAERFCLDYDLGDPNAMSVEVVEWETIEEVEIIDGNYYRLNSPIKQTPRRVVWSLHGEKSADEIARIVFGGTNDSE
jgi:hypothetical protein